MLENYFNYKKYKTDFKTEVIAGTTTFLTMAYIMFLNPFILSGEFAGPEKGFFDFGAVYTATILATALACFIMAFYGKTWPIGLAPGMGINAFVAFGVCAGMGYTPQEALGAVLVAGVLFLIISLTPIRSSENLLPFWAQPLWAVLAYWRTIWDTAAIRLLASLSVPLAFSLSSVARCSIL